MRDKPPRIVSRSQDLNSIAAHRRWTRDLEQEPAVRAAELKRAVRLSIELVPLLVDGAVVAATEQREIRERGGAALRPVTNVMALAEADPAAREAAASVPMVERSSQSGRDSPGPGPDLQQPSVLVVPHHHPAGVARQALRRSGRNAHPVLEDRLARLV